MAIPRRRCLYAIANATERQRLRAGKPSGRFVPCHVVASDLADSDPGLVASAIAHGFVTIKPGSMAPDELRTTQAARDELHRNMVTMVSATLEDWSEVHRDTLADTIGEILDPDGLAVDKYDQRIDRALADLEREEMLTLCRDSGVITRDW